MRIYEFAKEKGLTSKDIIGLLEKNGFAAPSHMSVLSDEALQFLNKSFSKPSPAKKEEVKKVIKSPSLPAKETKAAPVKEKKIVAAPSPVAQGTQKPVATIPTKAAPVPSKNIKPEALPPLISKEDLEGIKPLAEPLLEEDDALPFDIEEEVAPIEKIKTSQEKKTLAEKEVQSAFKPRKFVPRKEFQKTPPPPVKKEITEVTLSGDMPLFEVANLLGKPSGEIILTLLKQGTVCNRNQILPLHTIARLAESYNITVHRQSATDKTPQEQTTKETKDLVARSPIVVVMGHVDHGKTTLLDYIRKMNVAGKEKGGITQHLGAYEADSKQGKIVFLDTPGHQAFSYIRKRGVRVTDFAVLVVAADDGIKPQTIEAIDHAKKAGVPIVVAINKVDKVQSRNVSIETIKRQLAQHDLIPEDWGGPVICVPISAKTGEGVDALLEMIILQSQIMELKSNISVPAQAFVLESKLERGYGSVASVICVEGTIKVGDYFICGSSTGKVRLLIDSHGRKIQQAGPSVPVQVVGFDKFVSLGDWLKVVPMAEYSKARSSGNVIAGSQPIHQATAAGQAKTMGDEQKALNLIIKTDTQGSLEAIKGSMQALLQQNKDIPAFFQVIQADIGDVSEGDVTLAANTGARILTLHAKAEKNALTVAKEKDVEIQSFQIIYNLVDYLRSLLEVHRRVKITFKKVGEAVVRKVFDIKGIGIIAGCYIKEGVFSKGCKVVCVRRNETLGEGKINSLQRDRKVVKEVHGGFECGFTVDGFQGWQEDDTVQAFIEVREKQVGESTVSATN